MDVVTLSSARADAKRRYTQKRTQQIDLREWAEDGSIPNDRDGDSFPLMTQVINDLSALYLTDEVIRMCVVPAGGYESSNRLSPATVPGGFGIKGEGRTNTTFYTPANKSWFGMDRGDEIWTGPDFVWSDMIFEDLTVDGSEQPDGSAGYISGLKGFIMHHFKDSFFRRVTVRGTHATGFGIDDADAVYIVECLADGNGRARFITDPAAASRIGSGSGFGIGFGSSPHQTVYIIDSIGRNNAAAGAFAEKLGRPESQYSSTGMVVVGGLFENNATGINDAGTRSSLFSGSILRNNLFAGMRVGVSLASEQGGRKGVASGMTMYGNENGVVVEGNAGEGYLFANNQIFDNLNAGVLLRDKLAGPIRQGLRFESNDIRTNGTSGILSESTLPLSDLWLTDNHIYDNGKNTGKQYGDGITFLGPLSRPHIHDNREYGNRGYALALRGAAVTSLSPRISRNDWEGSPGGTFLNQQTIADMTRVTDNIGNAATSVSMPVTRPTPSVDTTGWQGVGTRTWEAGGLIGLGKIKCVATDTSARIAGPAFTVAAGQIWRVSIYVQADKGQQVQAAAVFGTTYVTGEIARATGLPQRLDMVVQVPAGATQLRSAVVKPNSVIGDVFYADGSNATQGHDLWKYIDGAQPGCAWAGAAYASASTLAVPA